MSNNEQAEQSSTDETESTSAAEIPEEVISEAERLTRLARSVETAQDDSAGGNEMDGENGGIELAANDEAAVYRDKRDALLTAHDYTARVREDDETLVLYPDEWLDGDTVVLNRIEDTGRAIEVSLSARVGEETFAEIERYNRAIVEQVATEYGDDHAANLRAFADFMGNHYLLRIDAATDDHLTEFRTEYYPRNVWPTETQRTVLDDSLELLSKVATQR